MRLFPGPLLIAAALVLSACGGNGEERPAQDTLATDTLATDTPAAPAETTDIRDERLTPAILKDPRIETLRPAERRILRAHLARLAQLQQRSADSASPGGSAPPESLARWLDTNLTVGEVINMNRGVERVEPEPPQPLPKSDAPSVPDRAQQ